MLIVETTIGPSQVSGTGLFANQFIPKGAVIWEYKPGFDLLLSKEEIEDLSPVTQEQVYKYAYLDNKYGKYLLCSDDARFFNHSESPNCDDSKEDITTAIRDIEKGEELLVNYRVFYGDIDKHPEINNAGSGIINT